MGPDRPLPRPAGSPKETLIWQDPIPAVDHPADRRRQDIAALKAKILASGLSVSELVSTAWASASTFRGSDSAAAPTARAFASRPQKDWEVNQPGRPGQGAGEARSDPEAERLGRGQEGLAGRPDRARRLRRRSRRPPSDAGVDVKVSFDAGRADASQESDRRRPRSPRSSRGPTASATTCNSKRASVHGAGRGVGGSGATAAA